jgi:hypothetical protein
MTAVAMIFVVGWLVVLSFAIAAVTVAMKTVRPSSSPEHEQLVRSLRPTHHYEFPAVADGPLDADEAYVEPDLLLV